MFIPNYAVKINESFLFGAQLEAIANKCMDNDAIRDFWRNFCCQASELSVTPTEETVFFAGEAARPELDGHQYAVNVEKTGFYIVGDGETGLRNGFITLLHQIKALKITDDEVVLGIPCGVFRESPRVKNQMVHFCVFPETKLWELERFIRFCAALKYTHIIIEFWGTLKYDCLKELAWENAFTKEQIRPLIKTAGELGIEIIPMFNHWGHASLSRVNHGKHVVLDQNPRLQPLFSADGWTWNIENPDVIRLLQNVREELTELCGNGEYFHLGCDEPYNFEITTENYRVVTDYLNGIADELSACGRRAIVWGDMMVAGRDSYNKNNRYTASCKNEELERELLRDLDKKIIIADWQYNVREAPVETSLVFKEGGFDTLICPWDRAYGNHSVPACVSTAEENDLFGVIHTTWNTLSIGMREVAETAFASWSGVEKTNLMPYSFFGANAAKVMRRAYPVNGDYEKAGWAQKQVAELLK